VVQVESNKPGRQKLTTQRLNEMAFAFRHSATLVAAIDIGLFTAISEGAHEPTQVAEKLDIPAENIERLMIACAALDLLTKENNKYNNAPDVEKYLVKTISTYFGDYLVYQTRADFDSWKNITNLIKPPKARYESLWKDPQAARTFTVAGYNSSISAGHKLAREFNFSDYSLFLDLGGGSGCYSIAACLRHQNLRALVFDHPYVCAVAEEFIAQAGLSDRIKTHPGNFFETDYPEGADLVSYITPLQVYEKDDVQWLINKAVNALEPGGTMLIVEYMLDDDKKGPLDSVFRHLMGLAPGREGCVNTGNEFCEYLEKAGCIDMQVTEFIPGSLGRITAKKPK
jgi:hypothetical protein